MSPKYQVDWDPRADEVQQDQLAAYDAMRRRCPVAYSAYHQWSLFRHSDLMRVLEDHKTFSNAVSAHLSVPNGMDPPEHGQYRAIIEPFFSDAEMSAFEPVCRQIAENLVAALPRTESVELVAALAQPFALKVQCAFLGWPASMQEILREWSAKNQKATLARDREALARIADEFASYITNLLQVRRQADELAPHDITTRLLRTEVHGRPLRDDEIVSILRNWTAGEIGTIAASVSILVQFLAEHPALQQQLREQPKKLPEAIDEILRLHGPLVTNRRLTTCPVRIGDRAIGTGERLSINWVSANRDEEVFEDPANFRWGRDPSKNLLYGAGIHVCPGAPLARLELRLIMQALLSATAGVELAPEVNPEKAVYPASGFSRLEVVIR